jgi:hypothetical protein
MGKGKNKNNNQEPKKQEGKPLCCSVQNISTNVFDSY